MFIHIRCFYFILSNISPSGCCFLIQIFLAHYNKYFPSGVRTLGAGSRRGTRTRCWTTRPSTPAPSAGAAAHAARSTGSGQSGLKSHFVLYFGSLWHFNTFIEDPGPHNLLVSWSFYKNPRCQTTPQHPLLLGMPIISPTDLSFALAQKIANRE